MNEYKCTYEQTQINKCTNNNTNKYTQTYTWIHNYCKI